MTSIPTIADRHETPTRAGSARLPAMAPADREGRLPLSFAQRELWSVERLGSAGSAYHVAERLRLRGALDHDALERALRRIVARHEALRTTFPAADGEPEQRIAPAGAFFLERDDATDADFARVVAGEAAAPFDLEAGPLFRARLVRLASDDHVLLLTAHAMVADAASMGVLLRELATLYAGGEGDAVTAQPVDFAAWQRGCVAGGVLDGQAEYWTRALAGAPELLELPTDRPRPARRDHAGAAVAVELDARLAAALTALAERHGAPLSTALLAGWAALLGRLTGQDDVVVGTHVANRERAGGAIGAFADVLPLRVDLAGSPTVAELLARVNERELGARRNGDLPFDALVERVGAARGMAHHPLFQVAFAWTEAAALPALPGLTAERLERPAATSSALDLTLALREEGGRIVGRIEYAASLFDHATVERVAGYLRGLLERMAADEDGAVARLPLLPDAERAVLDGWNATGQPYPAGPRVHDLFRAQAERTPDAPALWWRGATTTYAELDRRANQLAHALRGRGVGPEVRVGVCLPRTPDLAVALLGVLKAGGAYVPLDPAYPRERLGYMLEDAGIALVITESALADRLPATAAALLVVDRERDAVAAEPADAPESGALPENLSHVIFTSGSTGRPKGVMIRHSSTVILLHWMRDNVSDEERRSALFSTSINFDVSVAEFFGTLCWGGKLVMVENALELATVAEPVVYASMVPSAAAELLRSGGIPATVRTLNLGGEALPSALARGLYALGTVASVGNLYGPTEDTTYSTYSRVARGGSQVFVGRPVSNTQAHVLDAGLQPVPVGVIGELYLAGDGLARGYAGHPAMTAERFIPNPFGAAGSRMYRVMDRVRWRADGELEYLGRTDFQVKVRGYRIELGEIEARLAEHAGVRDAVVLAREDVPGDRRLVAYYVARGGATEVDALRAHLAERVPEYMVPSAYVRLDALPQTPNGKLNRQALPAPDSAAYSTREFEAPVGAGERALAEIWADVLHLDRVGRWDNFFDLGGHSLLAMQVVTRVRQALGADVTQAAMFERPVLADFARALESAARAELSAIERVDRDAPVVPSFAQQRLWLMEQFGSTGAAYHIPTRLRLTGTLDHGALVRALDQIVRRHEVLRTTFDEVGGTPVLRVGAADTGFHLVEHDLTGAPDADAALHAVMVEERAAPFDLARGPLIRGRLARLAADDHVLLITMHHIVSDGWSMGVFTHELSALYAAFSQGRPDPLPELPVQYADYAAWHRRWVESEVLEVQAEYWTRTLDGAPELLELPTDHPRPMRQGYAGGSLPLELDAELTAGLKALNERQGSTLFMSLLAAWAATLGRLAGQDEVVVGTPTANRGLREIEDLIGFFTNTVAVRVDLGGSPTVAELLGRVKERALGAQQNQDIPFEQVIERVNPVRTLSHAPLFQVMFAWQNAPRGDFALPGLAVGTVAAPEHDTSRIDLLLNLQETGGRITGEVEYATALFERATVERYVGYMRRMLAAMVADESRRVDGIELLPAAERARVVAEWNATDAEYPADACIHELFEAQAERTPHAVAVLHDGVSMTYAELNQRANRLANHLRGLGVGPEARVGICLERTPHMVAALLATLKAGGAYVP
ncbi:MAG TPA: amino acid adenylation domain-containing protein, partial [Longimicrobium sp.]|nr:amino acid adenylation domain-containing protein [Longimicrobium sp.]